MQIKELDAVSSAYLYQWAMALAEQQYGAARLSMRQLERRLDELGLGDRVRNHGRDADDLDLDLLDDDERAQLARLVRKAGGHA